MSDPCAIAMAFHAAINRRDVEALCALMTEDHRFVDHVEAVIDGKEACRRVWREFFLGFPDYRNEISHCVAAGAQAAMAGRSHSSDSFLDGPALWSAVAEGDKLSEWRVYEDTPANRTTLGLPA
jgi:ketosteroid isomerase-like protein